MSDLRFNQHYSKTFNAELAEVRAQVLHMGGLVDTQVERAAQAMVDNDVDLAAEVVEDDHRVNAMEVAIDEECTRIIALRAPAATDLRLVITVIKTITDLERMGDEAARVARMVQRAESTGIERAYLDALQQMADEVRVMLAKAMDAFNRNDPVLALETTERDATVDEIYQTLLTQLTESMARNPGAIGAHLAVLWAARSLERIGDRAHNICEYVIYLVGGKDVRHTSPDDMAQAVAKVSR